MMDDKIRQGCSVFAQTGGAFQSRYDDLSAVKVLIKQASSR